MQSASLTLPSLAFLLLGVCCSITTALTPAPADDARVLALRKLRDKHSDKVLHLSEQQFFEDFGGAGPRPYSLAVFFTAKEVASANPSLKLNEVRKEFGLAAKAVAAGPDADKLFFASVTFEDAKHVFKAMDVTQLPLVVRFAPDTKMSAPITASKRLAVPKGDKMTPETTAGKYPWSAETFISYLAESRGVKSAPIDRPSFLKSPLFWPVVLVSLGSLVFGAYRLEKAGVLRHPFIYAVASILVMWFSVSGGMYNIIRGVPLYIINRQTGRPQFFLSQRGQQLGGEGFIMGAMYIVISAALTLVVYGVPRIKQRSAREGVGYFLAIVAGYLVYKTFEMHAKKSGYVITHYLW